MNLDITGAIERTVKENRENTIAGIIMTVASQLTVNEAHNGNHPVLEFAGIAGLGVFAFYTLFSLIELIEIETGTESLYRQSVDCAQKVVEGKIGVKQ